MTTRPTLNEGARLPDHVRRALEVRCPTCHAHAGSPCADSPPPIFDGCHSRRVRLAVEGKDDADQYEPYSRGTHTSSRRRF